MSKYTVWIIDWIRYNSVCPWCSLFCWLVWSSSIACLICYWLNFINGCCWTLIHFYRHWSNTQTQQQWTRLSFYSETSFVLWLTQWDSSSTLTNIKESDLLPTTYIDKISNDTFMRKPMRDQNRWEQSKYSKPKNCPGVRHLMIKRSYNNFAGRSPIRNQRSPTCTALKFGRWKPLSNGHRPA